MPGQGDGRARLKIGGPLPWSGPLAGRESIAAVAAHVEAADFDYVSVADHVLYPKDLRTPHPFGGTPPLDPSYPRPDVWAVLSYVAARTTTLRLRTGIYLGALRSPFLTAKAIATADWLSGGRVEPGLGVGWMPEEFDILGVPFKERGARLDENVALMRALWSGQPSYTGRFNSYADVWFEPRPVQQPVPLWFGGNSAAAIRRVVASGDGWMPGGGFLTEGIGELRRLAEAAGRDPATIGVSGGIAVTSSAGSAADADALVERAAAQRRLGVTHIGVGVGELGLASRSELLDRVDWAAANVLPHLRSL